MSTTPVIRATGLGKQYRLGRAQQRHNTIRDAVSATAGRILTTVSPSRRRRAGSDSDTLFWALRDVSFDVTAGEVLGVIGANGAGKSTLLKILCRITEPTEGRADLRGRVGSLLEVGTGFHSELTGRENTYLSGAILGMPRAEIDRKFDEIVEFAEVERFIDTPVKHYSSGMYLRLAFAVAAHLEPDILIVDEVLAVGDVSFQRKCLGKMDAVARGGRTVLFVSHNMDAVRRLCSRCIFLTQGYITDSGDPAAVVTRYLSSRANRLGGASWTRLADAGRKGNGRVRFVAVRYSSHHADTAYALYPFGPFELELLLDADEDRALASLAVNLRTQDGVRLINADSISLGRPLQLTRGLNRVRLCIEQLCLMPGVYSAGLWAADSVGAAYDHLESAFDVEVVSTAQREFGTTPEANGLVPCRFSVEAAVPVASMPEGCSDAR
jgi:lipopolysaccharide transport system ATP-binding protein